MPAHDEGRDPPQPAESGWALAYDDQITSFCVEGEELGSGVRIAKLAVSASRRFAPGVIYSVIEVSGAPYKARFID